MRIKGFKFHEVTKVQANLACANPEMVYNISTIPSLHVHVNICCISRNAVSDHPTLMDQSFFAAIIQNLVTSYQLYNSIC